MTLIGGAPSSVAPDPVLTNLAVELGTGGDYVADQIAPVATVERDEFKYAKWGREEIKDDNRDERAPGTGASEIKFSKTFESSAVKYRGLNSRIPDEIRNNDPNPAALAARRVKVVSGKIRLGVEKRVQNLVATGNNTRNAPSTKWDAANATIREDIMQAREDFRRQAGMYPNIMVLPPSVRPVVFNDSQILDLLKHTTGSLLADGTIAQIENMQLITPGIISDTSNPGAAASIADVWNSDEVYYLYVDPNAGNDLEAQTALRQVRSMATTATPYAALYYRDPDASAYSDIVNVSLNQVELVISQEMMLRQLDVLT